MSLYDRVVMHESRIKLSDDEQKALEAAAEKLKRRGTKTGGRFRDIKIYTYILAEPARRRRLDHFGNEGQGWDSEGWEEAYAAPLRKEVEALLGKDFSVDIGDKGHVYVYLKKKKS